ncbi:MAG: twin-arginine translocase subunit TatC [Candidatus Binatia bacterium]
MADVELPLTSHLAELRQRLSRALIGIVVAFAFCYPNSPAIFAFLLAPLYEATGGDSTAVTLIGTGVAEAFFTRLKVSFLAALFVALPVILYQVWMFVVPGLRSMEARYARGFVLVGSLFFLGGAWFCYEVVFAFGFPFFLEEYRRIGVDPTIRISEYLSFSSRLLLAFGITFELPVVTFFLARIGLVTHTTLINYGRYAFLATFVLAAILTPPDVVSQILMAGPLLLLYGLSIGVAYLFGRH